MPAAIKLIFILMILQLGRGVGHACSCSGPRPVCSIQLGSSSIFRGTVVEKTLFENVQTVKRTDGTMARMIGNGKYKVRFAVQETFSGEANSEEVVYTAQQGSACGFPFAVGREYIVFTYQEEGGLWTSHCSRTALLEPGVENAAVTWMRNRSKAPSGSEIFGSVLLPRDTGRTTVPATVRLDGPQARTVATDKDGKYSAADLKGGVYMVSAQVPDGFAAGAPRKVDVAEKGCAEVDWYVTYEGKVRGRVLDVDGKPVADLRLELLRSDEGVERSRREAERATTGMDGSYAIEHVSPGEYVVAARSPGWLTEEGVSTVYFPHAETEEEAQRIRVGDSATVDDVNLVLAKLRATVPTRVRVVMPDGSAGRAGLELFAFPQNSRYEEPTRSAITDVQGVGVLPLFAGKEYYVSVALDRNHTPCGSGLRVVTAEGLVAGVLAITKVEACAR